jgi:hypothetical protein
MSRLSGRARRPPASAPRDVPGDSGHALTGFKYSLRAIRTHGPEQTRLCSPRRGPDVHFGGNPEVIMLVLSFTGFDPDLTYGPLTVRVDSDNSGPSPRLVGHTVSAWGTIQNGR